MIVKTNTFVLFLLLSVLIGLSACKNTNPRSEETLNIGVMSSMDYLPLAVAQREGYFEEEGLNIKIQKFYSANERDAAFQGEVVDGVVIDYTGAILQKAGGIDLKLTSKCDAPFYIVANNSIDSLPQLRGKQVAVSQNTVIDYCVDMALKSAGMSATDINKVEINKIPLRFEMLQNNKIDATGLPNPFALMAQNSGKKIISSNADLGLSITGLIFSQKAINNKSELIGKMYSAYNKGVDYLANHSVEDIQDILIQELGFKQEIISATTIPAYTKAQTPADSDIQSVIDWLTERGLIDSSFDKSSLIDSRFVK